MRFVKRESGSDESELRFSVKNEKRRIAKMKNEGKDWGLWNGRRCLEGVVWESFLREKKQIEENEKTMNMK